METKNIYHLDMMRANQKRDSLLISLLTYAV